MQKPTSPYKQEPRHSLPGHFLSTLGGGGVPPHPPGMAPDTLLQNRLFKGVSFLNKIPLLRFSLPPPGVKKKPAPHQQSPTCTILPAGLVQHLRGHVEGRAAHRPHQGAPLEDLGQSEVCGRERWAGLSRRPYELTYLDS